MTMQISDCVKYKNKKFVLIDIEKDKELFSLDKYINDNEIISYETSCYRGYTAYYKIINNVIYLAELNKKRYKDERLDFHGSIIIAYSKERFMNSDFLDSMLYFDEAYELAFEKGNLIKTNNLDKALNEYSHIIKEEDRYMFANSRIKEFLNSTYKENTYKW